MAEQKRAEQLLAVAVPVANLRREPVEARKAHTHDDLQETQLLFNETLLYRGEKPGWYYVEAREQLKADAERGWQGYAGWVRKESVSFVDEIPRCDGVVKSAIARLLSEPAETSTPVFFLSLGSRVALSEESGAYQRVFIGEGRSAWISKTDVAGSVQKVSDLRNNLMQTASLFIGVPYLWGGRSMFMADLTATVTGVDCSGLTNLIYRVSNIDLPRDAHDQWLVSRRVPDALLRPGDLVFVSQEKRPNSVNHVMFSMGGEQFIEAAETGSTVRKRTFREKFGLDLAGLEQHRFLVQGKQVYLATVEALDNAS